MTNSESQPTPSMDEILQSIRNVVTGDEAPATNPGSKEDILELTEMISTDGSVVSLKKENDLKTEEVNKPTSNDILANIDNALSKEESSVQEKNIIEDTLPQAQESIINNSSIETNKDLEPASPAMVINKPEAVTTEKISVEASNEPTNISASKVDVSLNQKSTTIETDVNTQSNASSVPDIQQVSTVNQAVTENEINNKDKNKGPVKKNSLISEKAAEASVDTLRGFVKSINKPHSDGLMFRHGTTLEDLVVEILKPQLSEWLDKNLPSIVKHIVEKEIKKLIPRDED